jgi:hypothetical protein
MPRETRAGDLTEKDVGQLLGTFDDQWVETIQSVENIGDTVVVTIDGVQRTFDRDEVVEVFTPEEMPA